MIQLQCFQCKKDTRKIAHTLSCSHSICPNCLPRYFLNNNFDSLNDIYFDHLTSSSTSLSPSFEYKCVCNQGSSQIQLEYYTNVLKELIVQKQALKCKKHPDIQGTVYCRYCNVWACDDCFEKSNCAQHMNPGELASHCSQHNFNKLDFFCAKCNVAMCRACIEDTHYGHNAMWYGKEDQQKKKQKLKYKTYEDLHSHLETIQSETNASIDKVMKIKLKYYDELIEKIEFHRQAYIIEMEDKMKKMNGLVNIIKLTYQNLYLDTDFDLEQLLKIKKIMNCSFHDITITSMIDRELDIINARLNIYQPLNYTFNYELVFQKRKLRCKFTSNLDSKINAMVAINKNEFAYVIGKSAKVYNYKQKKYSDLDYIVHKDDITCLALLENNLLATGSADKTVKIWNMKTMKEQGILQGHRKGISSICLVEKGVLVSSGKNGSIKVWDYVACSQKIAISGKKGDGIASVISLKNGTLASAGDNEMINIWDYKTLGKKETLSGHFKAVTKLLELKDERLASCSLDKTIRIWKEHKLQLTMNGHEQGVHTITQLRDTRIISGSIDQTARIWNCITGDCECILSEHKGEIINIVELDWILPNKKVDYLIASASSDKTFKIWI